MERCTTIYLFLMTIGSIGNLFSLMVFLGEKFRSASLTPFFAALLLSDSIYLNFRIIKLIYYQETLFKQVSSSFSCSSSFLFEIYGFLTQFSPQYILPLFHYEFYIRFSLILMSFLAVRRAHDIYRSSLCLIQRSSTSRKCSFFLICLAFVLSYFIELFSLLLFCSSNLSPQTSDQWRSVLLKEFRGKTSFIVESMVNRSFSTEQIECFIGKIGRCSNAERIQISRKKRKNFLVFFSFRRSFSSRNVFRLSRTKRRRFHPTDSSVDLRKKYFSKRTQSEISLPQLSFANGAERVRSILRFSLRSNIRLKSLFNHFRLVRFVLFLFEERESSIDNWSLSEHFLSATRR